MTVVPNPLRDAPAALAFFEAAATLDAALGRVQAARRAGPSPDRP